jgi:hypothetical protein
MLIHQWILFQTASTAVSNTLTVKILASQNLYNSYHIPSSYINEAGFMGERPGPPQKLVKFVVTDKGLHILIVPGTPTTVNPALPNTLYSYFNRNHLTPYLISQSFL